MKEANTATDKVEYTLPSMVYKYFKSFLKNHIWHHLV